MGMICVPKPVSDLANKADLNEILKRRPELKGRSFEAVKRILRREARLSRKPQRSIKY
jgi:hypothetical protein